MVLVFVCLTLLLNNAVRVSPIACNAEWCDPGHQPYDNIVAVMTGYNIVRGNPFVSGKNHDPGFATGYIFVPTYKDEDKRYNLQSGITVRESRRCTLTLNTETVTTLKEYRDKVGKHSSSGRTFTSNQEAEVSAELKGVGVKTTVPPLVDAAFSSSEDYQNNEAFFTKKQGVLTFNDATCSVYTVRISPFDPPPFTPGFINALKVLNTAHTKTQRESAFNRFMREFGTHFLQQTTMGARTAISRRYSKSEYVKSTDNAIKECNSQRLNVNMAAGPGVGQTSSKCKNVASNANDGKVEGFQREYITSYGSKPAASLLEWSNQKFDAPLPIKMELSQILNLFTKTHFKNHRDIDYKKILRWMGPLYYNYCENNKAALKVKSCALPKGRCGYDDTCVPRQQFCNNNRNGRGYHCCTPKCNGNPCKNGGRCKNYLVGRCDFGCTCKRGWKGRTCTQKVVVKSILTTEIESNMRWNIGKSNSVYANILLATLRRVYPNYYFTVNSYNQANGWSNHAVKGNGYVAIFRKFGRNVVVGWARKNSRLPSSSKGNQIQASAVAAARHKGRSAKTSMDRGWNSAAKSGYPIVMVLVVRHGNGLRTARYGQSKFTNFAAERQCSKNFWGKRKCQNHMSSMVIMFGSP